jgi:hypothetical protein
MMMNSAMPTVKLAQDAVAPMPSTQTTSTRPSPAPKAEQNLLDFDFGAPAAVAPQAAAPQANSWANFGQASAAAPVSSKSKVIHFSSFRR